jgi:hypothetical protein
VLAVLDAVVGEIATSDTPEGAEQTEALGALLSMEHIQLNVGALTDASQAAAAAAARELIALLAGVPEIEPSVNEWLADPPSQEAAAIPLILAAPVVLTGCVVLLQLVGHTSFRRDGNGKWSVSYDPGRRTPFDGTLGELVGALAKIMQGMTPPSS